MTNVRQNRPLTKRFLDFLIRRGNLSSALKRGNRSYTIITFDWASGQRIFKRFTEKEVKKAIYRLKGSGYILPTRQQSGKTIIKLTPKAINYAKERFRIKTGKRNWDGWWRLVIFDVPEKARDLRDHLRYALQQLGFKQLQQSVWIHPYDIFDELEKLIPDIKKHQWIKLLEARQIIGQAQKGLKKKFDLR